MKPTVTCVMLTADRFSLTRRAIEDWKRQTYENKALLILDSGREKCREVIGELDRNMIYSTLPANHPAAGKVGALRNVANSIAITTDLIAHFDSDDWSAPDRIEKQVIALETMRAEIVGYRSMVFYSTNPETAGAWYYSRTATNFVLGGSMLYTREMWRSKPFPELATGEDTEWIKFRHVWGGLGLVDEQPRMIARRHGRNCGSEIRPGFNTGDQDGAGRFRRVPELDSTCVHLLGEKLPC